MKKMNKTKVALALGLLCTGMASQAQWAVFNVSDALRISLFILPNLSLFGKGFGQKRR